MKPILTVSLPILYVATRPITRSYRPGSSNKSLKLPWQVIAALICLAIVTLIILIKL